MPVADSYFITWKGRRDGPFSLEQLEEMLKGGEIGLLHRVETTAGQVPLRQLLESVNAARLKAAAPSPAIPAEDAPPAPSLASEKSLPEVEATRLYVICGWCFALPPLAWRAWQQAHILNSQGYTQMAQRIKMLSAGLAAGGVLLWILIWRVW